MALDLNLLMLARRAGQDQPSLPGVTIGSPHRRAARGRQADRLILFLTLEGSPQVLSEGGDGLLSRLVGRYYKTPGTVTTAMRVVAEELNQLLLERNLRVASGGDQSVGILSMATLRGDTLYLAQCGPVHAFLITAGETHDFYDPQVAGRGLGLGRHAPIRYYQATIMPEDCLLITPYLPGAWRQRVLQGLYGQGLEPMRRQLLANAGPDLKAILIQARAGSGKNFLLRPKPPSLATQAIPESAREPVQSAPQIAGPLLGTPPAIAAMPEVPQGAGLQAIPTPAPIQPAVEKTEGDFTSARAPTLATRPPAHPRQKAKQVPLMLRAFAALGISVNNALHGLAQSTGSLARRMLPGEGLATLPSSVMAFIALATPLVVVSVAMLVYFQRGRSSQYQTFFDQAAQAAAHAQTLTDPQARRAAWLEAVRYLDQAESLQITPESQALRGQIQLAFDELDGVTRLNFQPAIVGGLSSSAQIIRMAATQDQLYLLDAKNGSVLRASLAGRGYEIDNTYQCGPVFPGLPEAGPLIDITLLPEDIQAGTILLGIDAAGNLLQCQAGEAPKAIPLAPPVNNWVKPTAFALEMGNLYLLDPGTNAVWVYWNSDYETQPEFFFSENVPPMEDVIDLVVDKSDLYLLHADGHLTLCSFSELGVSPTRCDDPVPYIDSRPGREQLPLIPEAPFTQLLSTQPPDPALYLLVPSTQSIYQFSLRLLTLHRLLRPQGVLSSGGAVKPATAFTLSPDGHVAFFSAGNEVFYAGMP